MIHAARYERMFPGEGGIDLVSLARAMPADIAVSIEVPTAELAKTVDAKVAGPARARRGQERDRGGWTPRQCLNVDLRNVNDS